MEMFVRLQAAFHGEPEVLRAIPFEEIASHVWRKRHTETWYPNESDLRPLPSDIADKQGTNTNSVLTASWLVDGMPMEMDYLEAVARAYPELEIAVIACVEYNYSDSGPEWNAYYSPAGSNTLLGTDQPFETFENQVSPSSLCITDAQGVTHAFTAKELAKELAQGTEGDGSFGEEDYESFINSDLSISDYPGIQLHIKRTADGVWSIEANPEYEPEKFEYWILGPYCAEDWETVTAAVFPEAELHIQGPGHHFLDADGNEYFLGWDWELCANRASWGFPEDADWIPFDLDGIFAQNGSTAFEDDEEEDEDE